MAQTKIKAGLFEGIIGNGTDGYFLMSNGDGTMTWSSIIINPTVTSIAYPGSATAADPAGGETITVTGTGFNTGATVTIGGTAAPAVSYVSATQITFTTPAKAAGDYDIVVTNTDTGSATYINGISYNGIPTWTTPAGSLGTFASGATISTITLQATEPDAGTITFNITNGALPTGLSLTGADIDGTTSLETADTLYTFTVTATDDESQATPRTFTITVEKQFTNTDNFGIVTYTGTNNSTSVSISSLDFQPDLIIHKCRNDGWSHWVYDSIRGTGGNAELQLNSDAAEGGSNNETYGYLASFNSNGFTSGVGTNDGQYFNGSGKNFVAWCFKAGGTAVSNTDGTITSTVSANPDAGFSIVSYTGTGSLATVGHGLNQPVELILVKNTSASASWVVYSATTGINKFLQLNLTAAAISYSNYWGAATPTNDVFGVVNASYNNNATNDSLIAYCFHSVDGYQKVGSYTGTGSVGSPTITTGFQPRFVMIKNIDIAQEWVMIDSVRGNNPAKTLFPNSSNVESTSGNNIDFNSDGFTIQESGGGINYRSGDTFIYLAIA